MNEEIKIMKPDNLLVFKKGYTPRLIDKLITENSLSGLRIFDDLDPLENIDFLNDCVFLKGLSIATRYDFGFEYLKNLRKLTYFSSQVIGASIMDFSNQHNLERLSLEWHKNIVGIENCKKLKRLGLVDFTEKNLFKIKSLITLETLSIKISNIESLDGIEQFVNLKKIVLGNCKKLTSIKAMNGLKKLEDIELDSCSNIKDYAALTQLPAFKKLYLWSNRTIDSIKFLNNFPALEQVGIKVNILDRDTAPLKRIKSVRYNHMKHYSEKIPTT